MKDISIVVGGKAGDGIKLAGNMVARLLNSYGYFIFVYEDYPSLIRGGHNFAIVRASEKRILSHEERADVLIALNKDAVEKHKWRLKEGSTLILDSDEVKVEDIKGDFTKVEVPMKSIVSSAGLPHIARNNVAFGTLAGILGLEFNKVEEIIEKVIKKDVEKNVEAARKGYEIVKDFEKGLKVERLPTEPKALLTGNEAIALGLVKGGMKLYVAYPMTPSSSILHYLAANEDELGIRTVHPESEIAVIGMAQGAAYAGIRSAVGTSGGGFALMVEHLSLAGQAEIPIVIVLSQRAGPATGVPTYTEQGDLLFSMFAGHGEFPRVVLAPGDVDEAFYLSASAVNLAWRFQIPVILLSDKHLSESTFSFTGVKDVKTEPPLLWEGDGVYKRYKFTENGVSPLAFPGNPNAIVKSNSYEHDEYGITTEEPELVSRGHEKRVRKMRAIEEYIKNIESVKVYGKRESRNCVLTWGSTKGAVVDACKDMDVKVVQPLYLYPLPVERIKKEVEGSERVLTVEVNSTGQFASWLSYNGIKVDEKLLRYDARPFTLQELKSRIKGVVE